jgi:hypothetical protein
MKGGLMSEDTRAVYSEDGVDYWVARLDVEEGDIIIAGSCGNAFDWRAEMDINVHENYLIETPGNYHIQVSGLASGLVLNDGACVRRWGTYETRKAAEAAAAQMRKQIADGAPVDLLGP